MPAEYGDSTVVAGFSLENVDPRSRVPRKTYEAKALAMIVVPLRVPYCNERGRCRTGGQEERPGFLETDVATSSYAWSWYGIPMLWLHQRQGQHVNKASVGRWHRGLPPAVGHEDRIETHAGRGSFQRPGSPGEVRIVVARCLRPRERQQRLCGVVTDGWP